MDGDGSGAVMRSLLIGYAHPILLINASRLLYRELMIDNLYRVGWPVVYRVFVSLLLSFDNHIIFHSHQDDRNHQRYQTSISTSEHCRRQTLGPTTKCSFNLTNAKLIDPVEARVIENTTITVSGGIFMGVSVGQSPHDGPTEYSVAV